MKKTENPFVIFVANLFSIPIKTKSGELTALEISNLLCKQKTSLFKKRSIIILFDRVKEQKSIDPAYAFKIINDMHTSDISSELAGAIVDKMREHNVGFGFLTPMQIAHMAQKVGLSRFGEFFTESDESYKTFLGIFRNLPEKEREHSKNIAVYKQYFNGVGKAFAQSTSAEPIVALI